MTAKYRTMKVFSSTDMSDKLSRSLSEMWDTLHQDSFIEWPINYTIDPDKATQKIDAWLLANGAEPNETVVIHFWW